MMKDTTLSIFHSAKRFFSGTAVSRITGLFRDIAMASVFGTNEAVAAFMVAFRLSHLLRRILGEGCLQSAFIPHFEEIRTQDSQKAYSFFRDILFGLTLFLLLLIIFMMTGLGTVIKFTSLSSGNQDILLLTILMLPSLLFICLYGLNASLLQCEKSYFIPSIAPAAFNIVWIISALSLRNMPVAKSMPWLAGATVFACFCQWLFTLPKTGKLLSVYLGSAFWKKCDFKFSSIKTLGLPLFLGMIGVAATQVNSALDAIFARIADPRGPALLWYAIRIEQLPLALFGIALSGALLPPLSRAIKAQDEKSFRHFLDFALQKTIIFLAPITMGIFIFGALGIHLIYARGDFSSIDTIQTTSCLWGYGIGLLPSALILIFAPSFYARGDYATPTRASLYSVVLNLFLNTLFIAGLGWGAASVAIATSISAFFNALFLGYSLGKKIGKISTPTLAAVTLNALKATAFASIAAFAAEYLMTGNISSFNLMLGQKVALPTHFFDRLFCLLIPGACFLGAFHVIQPIHELGVAKSK